MPKQLDLKSTLNLPKTAFPMKANLPQNEPRMLAEWDDTKLYQRIQEARASAPSYVLHDGPPYPTGTIHLGTALNKIVKDMVVKSKAMAGFRSPYVPGWDCHGLPIETQVEKELGGKKGSVPPAEFRRMCREFAMRFVDQHRRDFKRLGVLGRWDHPYLTMEPHHEATIAGAFLTFLEKGYIYRGLKPVYWCISDRTALAEAEVEYEDHTSTSTWVRYAVVDSEIKPDHTPGGFYALVWTTTPWTLPASMALSFNPHFNYVLAADALNSSQDVYIIAQALLERVNLETGKRFVEQSGPFPGTIFERAKFQHPFLDRVVPGVLGEHVTLEQGSGIVHTAPGHGAEDFMVGQEYGLETYAPVDDDGRFTLDDPPQLKGKTVFEGNPIVIELLKSRGALVAEQKIQHSYPHCWRCHSPVIFRATEQWFVQLDNGSATVPAPSAPPLRDAALAEIPKVQWMPAWGRERIHEMIAERPDWCISRQRFWGVPLIIFYCDECQTRLMNFAALRNVLTFFEKEGADAWYTHEAAELLPPATKCAKCGSAKWRKESDILDVWFDSGSTHLAVLASPDEPNADLPWPADMYLEGPDQYRGWFHSSLLIGVGVRGHAPYRQVLTHGWTLDEHGRPMSKSLGNIVLPTDVCDKWGADLLRLWVASQDYTTDVRMSDNGMTQLSEAYRKLRNTFRFVLGNLADFDPTRDALPDAEMDEFDRWMLSRTADLVKQCRAWYDGFEFHRVFHALHDYAVVDLSSFYFDVLKDRLYTFAPRNRSRRSAQTAMYRIASALLRIGAPILAFTSEEIWKYFPHLESDPSSVHLAFLPKPEELGAVIDDKTKATWDKLLNLRRAVLNALETARSGKVISGALEAKVILNGAHADAEVWRKYAAALPGLFIVSQVEIQKPTEAASGEVAVAVQRADGAKCERCWNYSTHVGENADYPTVCERCVAALEEIGRDPQTNKSPAQ